MNAVRPAVLAGSWYPADPDRLRADVDRYLAAAEPDRAPDGTPLVALAPHAGYQYSGPVAGKLFGVLTGRRFDAIFVLAPSHRSPVDRPVLSGMDAFATPLGEVPVATGIVAELAATGDFAIDDRAHGFEHAVEIQLPFIQRALPAGTPIVPILVPRLAGKQLSRTSRHLDRWRDGRHLFLVSSDLTHYGAQYGYIPFTNDVPARLEELDTGALLRFMAHDAIGLMDYGEETGITMCGLPAAALALAGARPDEHQSVLLDYARSADRDGDVTMSVSYAAALISDPAPAEPVAPLDPAERALLVDLARRAMTAAVRGTTMPDPAALAAAARVSLAPRLDQPRGAFVTLTARGALRGCIGYIEGIKPLVGAVVDNGAAAATEDPRFPAVSVDELATIHVEVSALTPLRDVDGPEAIEIGRHGIVLEQRGQRAVFLPQVALEQGWDLPTTLSQLARKAGLAPDAWRRDCRFQVFEAEICEE